MAEERVDVVVIGAGISGLSVTHWAKKAGLSVRVLEHDQDVGGTIKTIHEDGFLVETGPNSALETTPLIHELVTDLGLQQEFIYANPVSQKRYILRKGQLLTLPMSPGSFFRTPLFSTRAKLRLLKEPFIGKATEEESVAEFVSRRLGSEFLDYAVDPFVSGIYAGRPESLSVQAAFPKLYALEEQYGGLIRGMIRGRGERATRQEKAKDRARSFSFFSGMQKLPRSIAARLDSSLLRKANCTEISVLEATERAGRIYRVECDQSGRLSAIHARAIVLAVPAYIAANLTRPLSQQVSQTLSSIRYAPVSSVFLGYRREDVGHPLDGFGFLVPKKEGRLILGCLWSSSTFPRRAPNGMVAVTVFVGGDRQPELTELSDQNLANLVISGVKNLMQIKGNHVYLRATRWKRAIPQYEKGHLKKIKILDQFESQFPGFHLCSNYRGGISVGDCIMRGFEVAQRESDRLLRRTSTEG